MLYHAVFVWCNFYDLMSCLKPVTLCHIQYIHIYLHIQCSYIKCLQRGLTGLDITFQSVKATTRYKIYVVTLPMEIMHKANHERKPMIHKKH